VFGDASQTPAECPSQLYREKFVFQNEAEFLRGSDPGSEGTTREWTKRRRHSQPYDRWRADCVLPSLLGSRFDREIGYRIQSGIERVGQGGVSACGTLIDGCLEKAVREILEGARRHFLE
jgi:hypothetical protein